MRQPKYFIQTYKGKLELSKGSFLNLKNKKNKIEKYSNSKSLSQSVKKHQTRHSSPSKHIQKTNTKSRASSCYITPLKQKKSVKQNWSNIYDDRFVFEDSSRILQNASSRTLIHPSEQNCILQINKRNIKKDNKPSISSLFQQQQQSCFKSIQKLQLTKDQIQIPQIQVRQFQLYDYALNTRKNQYAQILTENNLKRQNPYQRLGNQSWMQAYQDEGYMDEETPWDTVNLNIQNLSIQLALRTNLCRK